MIPRDPARPHAVVNFGGNVRFTPRRYYAPTTEAEVLDILDRHARGTVRVVGALHSWNPAVISADALVDLRHLARVDVRRDADGVVWATVGGGCRIKHLLRKLRTVRATIPTLDLITEQTIAGAVSTATHGSGKHSLSHYVAELRVAAFDAPTGRARVYTWSEGDGLRAGRCALGGMGIILSVRLRCVPPYDVAETLVPCPTLDGALAAEPTFPLQQFFLIPHLWSYFVQRRLVSEHGGRARLRAPLYRLWWLLGLDIGLHLIIKTLVCVWKRPSWTRFFYRQVFSRLILKNITVVDRSERMLVMEHELFRHLEIEIFVPARHVRPAEALVRAVLQTFDGAIPAPPAPVAAELARIGMDDELVRHCGTYTHHSPIAFRRVLPDDTLISMSSGDEPYYAISFITYAVPRGPFLALASFLARSTTRLFEARLHWGKYFPLGTKEVARAYPRLPEFRALCRRVDPVGVFRNEFTGRVLFGSG